MYMHDLVSAVILANILTFIFGGVWYSKRIFGGLWVKSSGLSEQQCKDQHSLGAHIIGFCLSVVAAAAFFIFLGPKPPLIYAIRWAVIIAVCWCGTTLGINYAYSGRNYTQFLISLGHIVGQFVIFALIFSFWPSCGC